MSTTGSIELAVVVPSIRPEAMVKWLQRWRDILDRPDVVLIVVWDMPAAGWTDPFVSTVVIPNRRISHYFWDDIGEYKDLVPTKCDSVRNLGFLRAAKMGAKYIATLDDDVYPTDNLWVEKMLRCLKRTVDPFIFNTCSFRTRGIPTARQDAEVMLHHGLWQGIPDVYAKDQEVFEMLDGVSTPVRTVPYGQMFTMCGMNIAFPTYMLPAMYFWPQDKYRRYGDIWCGLFAKRVIDIMNGAVTSGSPVIYHDRLSDRAKNLEAETAGEGMNNRLWLEMNNLWVNHDDVAFDNETNVADIAEALANRIQPLLNETGANLKEWIKVTRRIVFP